MRCDEIADLLHAFGDGELDLIRNLQVEGHLRECPACTAAVRQQQALAAVGPDPAQQAVCEATTDELRAAVAALPVEFREVVVLRELEGLSYKDIAGIAGIPLGTVMSRLARARERLQQGLARHATKDSET